MDGSVVVDVGEFQRGKTRLVESVGDEVASVATRHVNADVFSSILDRLVPLAR
jgi:hypothetical protein